VSEVHFGDAELTVHTRVGRDGREHHEGQRLGVAATARGDSLRYLRMKAIGC
jgi:hypothetical protein